MCLSFAGFVEGTRCEQYGHISLPIIEVISNSMFALKRRKVWGMTCEGLNLGYKL